MFKLVELDVLVFKARRGIILMKKVIESIILYKQHLLMLKNTFLMLAENMKERVIESKNPETVIHSAL